MVRPTLWLCLTFELAGGYFRVHASPGRAMPNAAHIPEQDLLLIYYYNDRYDTLIQSTKFLLGTVYRVIASGTEISVFLPGECPAPGTLGE